MEEETLGNMEDTSGNMKAGILGDTEEEILRDIWEGAEIDNRSSRR